MGRTRALAAVAVAVVACARTAPPPLPPPAAEPDRFPHPAHAQLACTPCHQEAAAVAGVVVMPGADDHAACDNAACHGPAFRAEPGPLCRVCHTAVDPLVIGASPLRAYPAVDGLRSLPSRFSHAVHLDNATIEAAVGFNVACTDCHEPDAGGRPATAGHRACARCHADEVELPEAPAMSTCGDCHTTGVAPRTPRRLIVRDVRFDHGVHRADARGTAIACSTCHRDSRVADSGGRLPKPPLAACVSCHDDPDRVPIEKRMRVCETCHAQIELSFGALAPRSHLPASERPIDHTLAFRRDHAAEAADGRRCATCHTMMSGARDGACDECHQVMKPGDHDLVWREVDHGAQAIADRDRCATCHVADMCTACHQQRPRSHGPFNFGAADHGDLARQNPAACVTCHDVASDCLPCHSGMP
jgi:hypothetical protein